MESLFFLFQFSIVLVSDLPDAFSQSSFLLGDLLKWGGCSVKSISQSFELIFEGLGLLGEGVFLLFEVIILVFEDLNFFLHDVLVKIHFFNHLFDHSFIIFGRFGLGPRFHSGKELILFFEVVLFESDFAEFFLKFFEFSLFVGESVGPLILKGLEFLFL